MGSDRDMRHMTEPDASVAVLLVLRFTVFNEPVG
jgi:hypothetical protein